MLVYELKDKMTGTWDSGARAMIDVWQNYYHVSLDEFRKAVFEKGISFSKQNNGRAWIVDSENAKGVFSKDIQDYIVNEGFEIFRKNGVKYFITINSKVSALTKSTVNKYKSSAVKNSLEQIELNSVDDAIFWLKDK